MSTHRNKGRRQVISGAGICAIVLFAASGVAHATAFLLDPTIAGTPAFGRVLWGVNPVPDPGPDGIVGTADDGKSVVTLRYAIQDKAPAVNFIWHNPGPDGKIGTADDGPDVVKKNADFTNAQKKSLQAAAATWTSAAKNPAAAGKAINNVTGVNLKGKFDLESIALHELGHTLGLGHPNVGANNFAASPGNVNVEQPVGTPNAFVVPAKADKTNLIPSPAVVGGPIINGATPRPFAPGTTGTEAVMVQGSVPDELNNVLQFDDVQGLMALQSGADFLQGTADDFIFKLQQVGVDDPHEINFFNINLAGIGAGLTRSILDGKPTPGVNSVREFLDLGLDPLGNFTITTSLSDIWFTSANPVDPSSIGFADIFLSAIPEPGSIFLMLAGLMGLMTPQLRRRHRSERMVL